MMDPSAGPVLVTGAAGFIGKRLALALRSGGWRVRGFVRATHDTKTLERAGVDVIRGDAGDPEILSEAARGCSAILHLAAARGHKKLGHRGFLAANLRLAAAPVLAAARSEVARVVYASTNAVTGHGGTAAHDERSPPRPNNSYRASRAAAEERVLVMGRRLGVDVVVARVSRVTLGPEARDWAPVFRAVADGRFRLMPRGGSFHSADVDDIVQGFRLCMTAPDVAGERFMFAAAQPMPTVDLFGAIAQELGVDYSPRLVPALPFRAYLSGADLMFRLTHRSPPLHYATERLTARLTVNIEKARRLLGYEPRYTMRDAIGRTAKWLLDEGLV